MYFELTTFYKRDTYFVYNDEKNKYPANEFIKGNLIKISKPLIFNVDKLDNYIEKYDILPTYNAPLVSNKFRQKFKYLEANNFIQFIETVIEDEQGNINKNYYLLNILTVIRCMDMNKSVYDIKNLGKTNVIHIKQLFFIPDSLGNFEIARMEEKNSYIIVTEKFKKRCEDAKLKGFYFIEEGQTIYTDIKK